MPNPVFSSLPTSIFQHMTVLALKHEALNLGQGFPDQDGPISLREVAAKQLIDGPNQYPPSKGLPSCARRWRRMPPNSMAWTTTPKTKC